MIFIVCVAQLHYNNIAPPLKGPLKRKIDLSLNVRLLIVKLIGIDSSRPSHLIEVIQAMKHVAIYAGNTRHTYSACMGIIV